MPGAIIVVDVKVNVYGEAGAVSMIAVVVEMANAAVFVYGHAGIQLEL